ncbi:transposase (fragment) (plasmid) [Cupriavidus taiwanensis]|uniref:Transposase n=1 Tax=Cupriavidus taiwanensis TaxID=164546 RepID=A0A375FLQ0_9BURK
MYPVVFFDALRVMSAPFDEMGGKHSVNLVLEPRPLPHGGLKGMKQALNAVFPNTTLQTCIVHLDPEQPGVRRLEGAPGRSSGSSLCTPHPPSKPRPSSKGNGVWTILRSPRRCVAPEIRRSRSLRSRRRSAGSSTQQTKVSNAAQLRKIVKTLGHFPSHNAATKLLWLALRNIIRKCGSSTHDWKAAMNQSAILYEERFTHTHR